MKSNIKFLFLTLFSFCIITSSCKKDPDPDDPSNPTAITDADGNVYTSVSIGNQVWMKENLKTTKLRDGVAISEVTTEDAWLRSTTSSYCIYDNHKPHKQDYGLLYNGYAVKTGKLCPAGWHVPTAQEWNKLITYLGGVDSAGYKLKSKTLWLEGEGSNISGFTAVPAGYRDASGGFNNLGEGARFWTSTPFGTGSLASVFYALYHDSPAIDSLNASNRAGISVRCIKD